MNWSRPGWWPLPRGRSRHTQEAGAALFQGLRIRLTLWYCAVLAAALVLSGIVLYFSVQHFLLDGIENIVQMHAHTDASQFPISPINACSSDNPPGQPGPSPFNRGQGEPIVACFDQNGTLLEIDNVDNIEALPSAFVSNTLAQQALQTGSASDIVNAGGDYGLIYRYAVAVPNPNGNGYIGVVMDGASIQQQEDTLSLLLKVLFAVGGVALFGAGVGGLFLANRALAPARLAWANQQRFIADAAHELRTPLTLLRADAEVLLRSREHIPEEDAVLLEDIVAEANHMGNIATNLLTLARLDNRSSHQEYEVVDLASIARTQARRIQALADQQNISVQVESSDSALVIGDPTLLEQATLALLDNAIKYNRPGGRITVRTTTQQGHAVLQVSDTGIGISAEHLPHLGERFYRVDKARSREAGGTGLGLSIARGIALAHGGNLNLTSVPNQGTTVTITLPLAHVRSTDLSADPPGSVATLPEMRGQGGGQLRPY
jgi:signal transduction histidine kinase